MSAFDDYFARMMPDVDAWFAEQAAELVTGQPAVVPEPPAGGFLVPPELAETVTRYYDELTGARKLSSVVVVPHELLMDAGVIPDTRPKPPPPTWRTRLRWKLGEWRERAARHAYKIIAGYWPDGGEDDW